MLFNTDDFTRHWSHLAPSASTDGSAAADEDNDDNGHELIPFGVAYRLDPLMLVLGTRIKV